MDAIDRLRRAAGLLPALLLAACAATAPPSAEAWPNLGDLKVELVRYHDDGGWAADQARVGAAAEAWLVERVAAGGDRLAAVFDIDETSLNNWPAMKVDDFGRLIHGPCSLDPGPCGLVAWIGMAAAEPIPPTLAVYRRARERGVAVFFITGRKESLRAASERNLRAAGYDGWTALMLEPDERSFASAADFKAPQRAAIAADGYDIILNIGDQPSDLAGGYAERTFLLPNPYYRIP